MLSGPTTKGSDANVENTVIPSDGTRFERAESNPNIRNRKVETSTGTSVDHPKGKGVDSEKRKGLANHDLPKKFSAKGKENENRAEVVVVASKVGVVSLGHKAPVANVPHPNNVGVHTL